MTDEINFLLPPHPQGGTQAAPAADAEAAAEGEAQAAQVPCGVFSRVVGYLSPVNGWNVGKHQEFRERKTFDVGGV